MSYSNEEKMKVLHALDKTIADAGLRVGVIRKKSISWHWYLILLGLLIIGVCIIVHGV